MEEKTTSLFKEKHSLAIRLWHWTFFWVISSSLVMVLLASTFFRTRDNVAMVKEQVEQRGGTLTEDQARGVAHEYSDILWMNHKYIGYVLCFLLLCRIVIEIFISKEERWRTKIRKALAFKFQNAEEKGERRYYLFAKYSYLVFYFLIFVMALTGLGLAYEDVPLFDEYHRSIKNVHSYTQYFIYAYIFLHLAGVIHAELTKGKGIVSGMINGKMK